MKESARANGSDKNCRKEIESEFPHFWQAYPHKVGKGAALPAFIKARNGADLATILTGLKGYVRTKPGDRQWCNPATWLNQLRWLDQPAAQADAPRSDDSW